MEGAGGRKRDFLLSARKFTGKIENKVADAGKPEGRNADCPPVSMDLAPGPRMGGIGTYPSFDAGRTTSMQAEFH